MRSNRINYVVVGVFVLLVLAGFLAAVAMLTGRTGATDTYYTQYDNVAGVKYGTQVLYEGYPIGQVQEVRPKGEAGAVSFEVEMTVESGFEIPEDSKAVIASTGLLSGVSISIRGGSATTTLEPGSRIASGPSTDVFAAVSKVAGKINELSESGLAPLLDKLNRYVDVLGKDITESTPRMLANLEQVTRELRDTAPKVSDNVETFSRRLNTEVLGDDNLGRIERTLANLEAASATVNETVLGPANQQKVQQTLDNLTAFSSEFVALARQLRDSGQQVDQLIASIDKLLRQNAGEIDQSVKDLRYTLQVISRHVDAITYNLEGTSRNMHEFARQIRQNPGLLLRGSAPPEER